MYNCIYSGHCVEAQCDSACPILAQTSYLLDRNGIQLSNPVFRSSVKDINRYKSILSKAAGKTVTVVDLNTSGLADGLTYCSICEHWKGSQLHCTVYNLKYSSYLEMIQKSWSYSNDDSEVEYIKIWVQTAKVLIVSNIDYVNFKDFQCQTLLSLLQTRMAAGLTTIIVSPPLPTLVGEGQFFARLSEMLRKNKVEEES